MNVAIVSINNSAIQEHDLRVIKVILQAIIDHPYQTRYRKINVKRLSTLLDDTSSSFALIQTLGFSISQCKTTLDFVKMPNTVPIDDTPDTWYQHLFHKAHRACCVQKMQGLYILFCKILSFILDFIQQ